MLRWAEVHLDRLLFNYLQVKSLTFGKGVFAVVKANAYGHGGVEVAKFLQENSDVYGFAVATYHEGAQLREAGITRPILVMSSTLYEGKELARELSLTPVVYDYDELKLALELSLPFHLKVDTGMGRLGFTQTHWSSLLPALKGAKLLGIMSHFSSADEDEEFTKEQLNKFLSLVRELKRDFPSLIVHAENSAALKYRLNSHLTHVRVGLALYGSKPSSDFPLNLKQVMEVKAKVLTVKELPPFHPISYSRSYTTASKERVGVVSFGYADGYPRELSNRGFFLVEGVRCPVRGRVCMDMTVVSLPQKVEKGAVVTVYGDEIKFDEIAPLARTVPYELMCRISQRVERVYYGLQGVKVPVPGR